MKKFISASINLNTSNHMNIGEVKQLDDVELDLSIYSNGVAAPLDGQIISLFVRRANNTIVQQVEGITPTGSKLKIKCKNSCFAVPGNTELELRLVDSTGGMSTSFFYVEVKESIGCSEDIEISKNEYEILDKVNKDEVQRIANEETRISNENIRQEAYKEIKSISSDIFKSSGSEIKIVDVTDWVDNTDSNSSAKYMYDIVHALKSTDVILDIYSSTSNMAMLKNCRVINDSTVRLFSDDKIGVKAVLVACYNIQGKQAYDEVVAARGSYSTIGDRFNDVDIHLSEKANNIDNARTTTAKDVTGAINELNTALDYKVMNVSNINTGTIATIPTDYKDIVVVMTIADAYKIFAPIKVLTTSFTASFDYLVDQGGPRDDYVVNITYNNGVLSFQKNARFRLNIAGDSTRETVEAATVKTEFPKVTNILYK